MKKFNITYFHKARQKNYTMTLETKTARGAIKEFYKREKALVRIISVLESGIQAEFNFPTTGSLIGEAAISKETENEPSKIK